VRHVLEAGRHAWLHVAAGAVSANGVPLRAGDGAAISDEKAVEVTASERAEILLFDLD
jgi:redox-sensitive bicupin YhaK (pirin superfamily)